jgi:hypothetical protein
MELSLGHDFSRVRVHSDDRAAASARGVGALAYTVGEDVAFASGRYRPHTAQGRSLIAHELGHVVQQRATGPVLQRQPDTQAPPSPEPEEPAAVPAAPARQANEENLEAVFAEFKNKKGKPPGPKLRAWAREYQKATGVPMDLAQLENARERQLMWGKYPPIPRKPKPGEEVQREPGDVAANEILPFKPGTTLVLTHVMDKLLDRQTVGKLRTLASAKEFKDAAERALRALAGKPPEPPPRDLRGIVEANPNAVLDLILDADVAKSATAVIKESSADQVVATIDVPATPAKRELPAFPAFTATMTLRSSGSNCKLILERVVDGKPMSFDISFGAEKTPDGSILLTPSNDFQIRVAPGKGGGIQLQVVGLEKETLEFLRLKEPVKLIDVQPQVDKEAQAREVRAAQEPPRSGPEVFAGTGFQYDVANDDPQAMFTVGWRLTFRPLGNLLQFPVQFQLDYVPKGDVWAEISSGPQHVISGDVPVTLRLLSGVRAGSLEDPDAPGALPRVPALGPTIGFGAGFEVGPAINIQVESGYFHNILKSATEKGPESVPTLRLGTAVQF